jgi:hypothetical protein
LLTILLNPEILQGDTLQRALSHSLLLGEVLPSIERLAEGSGSISPALVFFLLLGPAVHIAVLGRYLPSSNPETMPLSGTSTRGLHLPYIHPSNAYPEDIPERLATSSWMYLQLLSYIRENCPRYDSPLLADITQLLSACYGRLVQLNPHVEGLPATGLMLYRWKGQGTGVVPLSARAALDEWEFPQSPNLDILLYIPRHSECSRDIVNGLCDPRSRIIQEGYFDFDIAIT